MSPHRSPIPAILASGAIRRGSRSPRSSSALSALDGAACELGVSRETLAVALATPESRAKFAATHGIEDAELEAAVRAGVKRGIDDAEAAGALNPLVATGLRAIAARLPVDEAVALIEDGSELFGGAGGLLGRLGNLAG